MTSLLVSPGAAADLCDLLCFDIGAERFAMPLANVEEVVDGCDVDTSSRSGAMVGILRVRHELLAVFDASRVLQTTRQGAEPVTLVLPSMRGLIGLLVDNAEAAPQVSLNGLKTPPALVSADRVLDGVLRVGARWVGLVNTAAFVEAMIADVAVHSSAGNHGR
ncbi:MAG: chemotaxis protein CheW [Gemmatimonadaceae bacterium]